MAIEEKILLIGRHGKKQGENISPDSIRTMYIESTQTHRALVSAYDIVPKQSALLTSRLARTEATGRARMLGIFGVQPVPESQQQVFDNAVYPIFNDMTIGKPSNDGFSFVSGTVSSPGDLNENVFLGAEQTKLYSGSKIAMEFALNNPDATMHEGVSIIPYRIVRQRIHNALAEAVRLSLGKPLVQVATHAFVADTGIVSLLESEPNAERINRVEQYGGPVKMEDCATILFGYDTTTGRYTDGVLSRPGFGDKSIDVQRFMEQATA